MDNDALTDAEVLGPETALALRYAPRERRGDLRTVLMLDARMRGIHLHTRPAMLAAIKLAWWEERLAALSAEAAPAEPLLRSLAASPAAHAPADLALFPAAWRELGEPPWSRDAASAHAVARGHALLASYARALGADAAVVPARAVEGFALVELSLLADAAPDRTLLLAEAAGRFAAAGHPVWPRPLRPLGMLVEIARTDAEAGRAPRPGAPGRVARMAWHALTGR